VKRVVVHIDRLALRGVRAEDRETVASALRAELERQLARPDAVRDLAQRGNVARLGLGRVSIVPSATPEGVGAQAGRAIARGLGS
jgi:hypothetical protein